MICKYYPSRKNKPVFRKIELDWNSCDKLKVLTLGGLSLFFKILPISNTVVSAAYILATVHFLCSKLGFFSDMEYFLHQLAYLDLKVHKHFIGQIQMQCSPFLDCNWGKRNDPITCWYQLHPWYWVSQQGKCLGYPPDYINHCCFLV